MRRADTDQHVAGELMFTVRGVQVEGEGKWKNLHQEYSSKGYAFAVVIICGLLQTTAERTKSALNQLEKGGLDKELGKEGMFLKLVYLCLMGKQTNAILVLLFEETYFTVDALVFYSSHKSARWKAIHSWLFKIFLSEEVVNELLVMETKYLHGSYV